MIPLQGHYNADQENTKPDFEVYGEHLKASLN